LSKHSKTTAKLPRTYCHWFLVELSWPSSSGFTLQRADSLTSTTAWSTATILSTRLINGIRIVTVPNRFFRPHRP
jgi:hypothetical protein